MERQTLHLWRQKTEKETASLTIKIHKVNQIRHFKNKEGTEAEMYPAIVFGIVPGDAPVSYWTIFFSMYLVTVPKDPAKNNSHRFPLVSKVAIGKLETPRRRRQREGQKSNRLNKEKNTELCRCIVLFCTFFCLPCSTRTGKCLISRFMEDVNKRRLIFLLFLTLNMVLRNLAQKEFAIHFLSDVYVAVAIVVS